MALVLLPRVARAAIGGARGGSTERLGWNFLARVEYERNSGQKFFSRFLGLSHPILAKNNARKKFFNFLNFFAIFFVIFLPGLRMNEIRD